MKNAILAGCLCSAVLQLPVVAQVPRDNPPPSIENPRKERELRTLIAGGAATPANYLELARLDTILQRYADAVAALRAAADLNPTSAESQWQIGVVCWQYATRDVQDPAGRLRYIRTGIALEDQALQIRPDYQDAMTYKNILLRMQAHLESEPGEQARLLAEADALRNRVAELQQKDATDVAPLLSAFPEPFEQAAARLAPVRIGGNVTQPIKTHDVKPVYPSEAQDAHIQGVVIIEALIDESGAVANGRILRPIPGLNEAALGAVSRWKFMPTLVNGQPAAVLMTVTVNFTLR